MTPQEPQTAHDVSVREKLVAAAIDLFNRKGYASTTVREIVEAAGVTKPVLYYYFGSKEGIFKELIREGLEEMDRLHETIRGDHRGARSRIMLLSDMTFGLFQENLPLVKVMHSAMYGPPQGTPTSDLEKIHEKFDGILEELIEEGMRKGELRKASLSDTKWAILGALNIAMDLELCHPEMSPGREGLKRILAAVFDGVGEPEDKSGGR